MPIALNFGTKSDEPSSRAPDHGRDSALNATVGRRRPGGSEPQLAGIPRLDGSWPAILALAVGRLPPRAATLPYRMRRAYGAAVAIMIVSAAPAMPIAAAAHRAPRSAANVPASTLPSVTTTSLM